VQRVFGTPVTEYLPAFVLLILTSVYVGTAYQYAPDSRIMPLLVGWCMLALLALDLASRTATTVGQSLTRWLNPSSDRASHAQPATYSLGRQLIAVVWLAGLAALLLSIGVLYAVPLYLFAAIRLRGRRSLLTSVTVAGAMTVIVWLLFTALLHLQLYPGLLFGGG
jgi:tripartite tricarboxylate transporter TctB family protein